MFLFVSPHNICCSMAPFLYSGIEVRFRGAARAKWNESVQNGPHRTDIEHEKEEIYFDDRFCLWGRGKFLYIIPSLKRYSLIDVSTTKKYAA